MLRPYCSVVSTARIGLANELLQCLRCWHSGASDPASRLRGALRSLTGRAKEPPPPACATQPGRHSNDFQQCHRRLRCPGANWAGHISAHPGDVAPIGASRNCKPPPAASSAHTASQWSRSTVRCDLAEDQERSVKSVGQVVINRAIASSSRRWSPTEGRFHCDGKPAALKLRPGSVEVGAFPLCHMARCTIATDKRPH